PPAPAPVSPPPPPPPAVSLNPKPEKATYDASTNTFRGTMPQVLKLAMRAVQELGWTLVNVNDTLGLVTFETGMTLMTLGSMSGVSGSLTIMELSENQFRVTATGKQNVKGGQILALDLGSTQQKLDQVLNKMRELAQPPPDPATLAAAPKTSPHSSGRA